MKEIIKEHKEWRNQIIPLAKADLIKNYRGSALGWVWAIISPVAIIFAHWFTYAIGLKISTKISGHSLFLWLTAGLVPWFYINEMLRQGTGAINRYRYLVTKMSFPMSVISTFYSLSKVIVNIILIIIMAIVFTISGYYPDVYYLQIPFYIGLMFLFFTVWSMLASPISAMSKDFHNLVKSITTFLFMMSGVLWNVNNVNIPIVNIFLKVNPVTFVVEGFRNVFIYKKWFWEDSSGLSIFLLIMLILMIFASIINKKLKTEVPDVL